ncbi:MAG: hypothetical protein NTW28_06500 [Candidatus Solibacter sp.]|nr:hypothetical protein [Candidatus Solibacter sp.]
MGNSAVDFLLASPATGAVDRVWFSGSGGTLYARSRNGRLFETSDYEIWMPSQNAAEPARQPEPPVVRIPENGARLVGSGFGRVYALGRHLFRSDDGGRSWANLTAFKTDSVIGFGQRSVAVSPANQDQIVVANDFGVWRSMDGGLSWMGLNDLLPNLRVQRILATPSGTAGTRVEIDGMGAMELPPGGSVWQPVDDATSRGDAVRLRAYSERAGVAATAYGKSGTTVYLGTAGGRILISRDDGATFDATDTGRASGPVERIFVDPVRPDVALAALGGPGLPHVLRTHNAGSYWDALDSNLPNVPAHAITGERAAGAVYVATDQGVFWAQMDLDNAGSPNVNWISLSERLPPGMGASDVRLDAAGIQLYAAVEGYGVYATAAPHRLRNLRLVNAADFSTRAAAPGSLLSVIGGRVMSARGGNLDYPVLAAADDASQIQVPFDAVGPNVMLALVTGNGNVRLGMQVQPVSPAIFVGFDGTPILQDAESGLLLDARKAAHPGARLLVSATGLGKVTPAWPTGMAARVDNPPAVTAVIRAFVNGAPGPVTRATLAGGFIGFYVIEVQLPAINNSGPAELYITADGVESNRVQFLIEQ